MPVLKILHYPDPKLNKTADPVTVFDKFLTEKIQNMYATMQVKGGIGLAAIQVDIPLQIFVLNTSGTPRCFINAEITAKEGTQTSNEGCLSVPGNFFGDVSRAQKITLRYVTDKNEPRTETFEGLEAAAIQHEMDHLKGVLFLNHLEKNKKETLLRAYNTPPSPSRRITKSFLALFGITACLSLPIAGLGIGIYLVWQAFSRNFSGNRKERAFALVAGVSLGLWGGSLLSATGLLAGLLVGLAARALIYRRDTLLQKAAQRFFNAVETKYPDLALIPPLAKHCAVIFSYKIGEQDLTTLHSHQVHALIFDTLTQERILNPAPKDANVAAQQKIVLNDLTAALMNNT